jgi:signal peptidase
METLSKVLIAVVVVVFMVLFAPFLVASAWSDNTPAMVWVPSESMLNDNGTVLGYGMISPWDLIVLRNASNTRIVPYEIGKVRDYRSFGNYGDAIVYKQPQTGKLIIHRAMFWFDPNNPIDLENHPECAGMKNAGWITKGDNNPVYDQLASVSPFHPIPNEEVVGVARVEIPLVGRAYSLMP